VRESEDFETIETRIRPRLTSSLLLWIILAFFVVAVIWAALTKIDKSVNGLGRVIPTSQLQIVSNLEGGIVDEIFVKIGQNVVAGAALVRLDQTLSGSELGSSNAAIAALVAKVERLRAEVSGAPPIFPSSEAGAGSGVEVERLLYRARMNELAALSAAGAARITQAERAVSEARSALAARQSAAFAARSQLAMLRPLVERGIEPRMSLVQAESAAASASSEAAAASSALARAQAGVSEAAAARIQQIQDWRARGGNELETAQAELSARRGAIPALADKVKRTLVTAPVGGKINRVLVATKGGSVGAGSPLVEIVPSNDGLIVEAQMNPKDIASVRLGQQAKVSITAYDSSIYGSLTGSVITISPDAIINERTGESHYLVRVKTDTNALNGKLDEKRPIGPGMLADVSLLGDKQTVLSYIFSPFTKIKETAFRE
jgi:membrane fusion protein, adhesin transport system